MTTGLLGRILPSRIEKGVKPRRPLRAPFIKTIRFYLSWHRSLSRRELRFPLSENRETGNLVPGFCLADHPISTEKDTFLYDIITRVSVVVDFGDSSRHTKASMTDARRDSGVIIQTKERRRW